MQPSIITYSFGLICKLASWPISLWEKGGEKKKVNLLVIQCQKSLSFYFTRFLEKKETESIPRELKIKKIGIIFLIILSKKDKRISKAKKKRGWGEIMELLSSSFCLKKAKRTPKAKKHNTKVVRKKTRFALWKPNLLNKLGALALTILVQEVYKSISTNAQHWKPRMIFISPIQSSEFTGRLLGP
jgi:hypothetical protein